MKPISMPYGPHGQASIPLAGLDLWRDRRYLLSAPRCARAAAEAEQHQRSTRSASRIRKNWLGRLPPLSELEFVARRRRRLLSLGVADLRRRPLPTGINFVTTILKVRVTGMGYMRMPVFCSTALTCDLLHSCGFSDPDRAHSRCSCSIAISISTSFGGGPGQCDDVCQPVLGGGSPESLHSYLARVGIFSEVIATFSGRPLFGCTASMVAATMAICVLSFLVWLHHFFTMGASASVNGFFGVMTMIIAVPRDRRAAAAEAKAAQ